MTNKHLYHAIEQLHPNSLVQRLSPVAKQRSHQYCMICGPQALRGINIDFYRDKEHVWAIFENTLDQQGYDHIVHGGFSAALLDAVMCQSLFAQQVEAVTAEISIRYLHEIPSNSTIVLKGQVLSSRKNLYKVRGELYVNQQLMAKSEARFMQKSRGGTNGRTE